MSTKIRYRLAFNYAGRLNRYGMAPVAIECRQDEKKFYISSKVLLRPDQWDAGKVVNHENADKLNVYLYRWKSSIEEIELNALLEKQSMTLSQLHDAIKNNSRKSASIKEFINGVMLSDDNRKPTTKRNYILLASEMSKRYGEKMTIEEITRDFVIRYKKDLKKQGLSENTIKARLKLVKAITREAIKRKIIKEDPFESIVIGKMTPRSTFLTFQEVKELESLTFKNHKYEHIRDAFVWCCCVGLRFSDFRNLKDTDIEDGVLHIVQQKTSGHLTVPLTHLFGGKPLKIMSKYKSVREFADIGDNSYANKTIKEIVKMAGIDKNVSWHCARHTAGTLLNQSGLKMQEIQKILGHAEMSTTANIYAVTTQEQVDESLKRAFCL